MKLADMTPRQRKAYRNIKYCAMDLIGGLENTISDSSPDSAETKSATAALGNHDELVLWVYEESITSVYDEGFCAFGSDAEAYVRDIRFCGRDWLMSICERIVCKLGY